MPAQRTKKISLRETMARSDARGNATDEAFNVYFKLVTVICLCIGLGATASGHWIVAVVTVVFYVVSHMGLLALMRPKLQNFNSNRRKI